MAKATTFDILGGACETTVHWLEDLREEIGWVSERAAYLVLRSTLHAVRDALTVEQSARLAEALPVLVRGVFYEGWNPASVPLSYVDEEAFLTRIRLGCRVEPGPDADQAATAVFHLLAGHLDEDEIAALRAVLPPEILKFWT
jgi:uncharacterized protein (DUF2267 family)